MSTSMALLLLVASMCALGSAHICMVSPAQRGGYDISEPGQAACFAPAAPCGSNRFWDRSPAAPVAVLRGGTIHSVLVTQALNHFNVGANPGGFLDISWALGHNQTGDDAFIELSEWPDYFANFQATLTNFSRSVMVPNTERCDWCTLQTRYVSTKPNEPAAFHNCADVKIVATDTAGVSLALGGHGDLLALDAGVRVARHPSRVRVFSGVGGAEIDALQDRHAADGELLDGTVAALNVGGRSMVYYLAESRSAADGQLSLAAFDVHSREFDEQHVKLAASGASDFMQWVTLIGDGGATQLYALSMHSANVSSQFAFEVHTVDVTTGATQFVARSPQSDTYINYMWAAYDHVSGLVSVLLGDEDAPQSLAAALWTTSVRQPSTVHFAVDLDVSQFTFESLAFLGGRLFTLTPGLVTLPLTGAKTWAIAQVDYKSGHLGAGVPIGVSDPLFPADELSGFYTGGVRAPSGGRYLPYLFTRSLDSARYLAWIDVTDNVGNVFHSTYLANDEQHYFDTLIYV
jgi:hypothetical protein